MPNRSKQFFYPSQTSWPVIGISRPEGTGGSLVSMLFGYGEDGFLFGNFAELDELFTTSTGPTAVASDSDPVGLALDDHAWGSRTFAQQYAQATESVTNGGFDADTGWPTKGTGWSISGGLGQASAASAFAVMSQSFAFTAGVLYRVEFTCTVSAGGVRIAFSGGTQVSGTTRTASGTYVEYLVALTGNNLTNVQAGASGFTGSVDNVSVKAVSGNHGVQATAGFRPLWKSNSGKPYLLPDGTDDNLLTPFNPTQSMAMFFAANFAASPGSARITMGGYTAANSRCWFGYDTLGRAVFGWGTENTSYSLGDLRGSTKVVVITGDASTRAIWYDGVLVDERAVSGSPAGTNPIMVGANNLAGTPSSFFSTGIFAAGALNRRVSPAEIARITSDFQRTYQ